MAKYQRVKLDNTTKAMSDMQKTLAAMGKTLSDISTVITNICNKIDKNLNKSLEKSKSNIDEIFSSLKLKDSNLNKFKSSSDLSINAMDVFFGDSPMYQFGRNAIYKPYKAYKQGEMNRQQSIQNANENYSAQINALDKARAIGKINEDQYIKGKADAIITKSNALQANSLINFNKQMAGTIEAMVIQEAVKLAKKIYDQAKKVIDETASYSVSTSYRMNSSAREQMLTWGLSESQNYAFSKTKELMNMSDEDLYWMNDNQRAMFTELMQKETEIYEQMTSDGTLESFQKMEIDVALLKQEFYANVVKFVSENKDTIMYCIETSVTMLESILNVISTITKYSPRNLLNNLISSLKGGNTITLNNYISETSNSTDTANKVTDSTLATLATYANS